MILPVCITVLTILHAAGIAARLLHQLTAPLQFPCCKSYTPCSPLPFPTSKPPCTLRSASTQSAPCSSTHAAASRSPCSLLPPSSCFIAGSPHTPWTYPSLSSWPPADFRRNIWLWPVCIRPSCATCSVKFYCLFFEFGVSLNCLWCNISEPAPRRCIRGIPKMFKFHSGTWICPRETAQTRWLLRGMWALCTRGFSTWLPIKITWWIMWISWLSVYEEMGSVEDVTKRWMTSVDSWPGSKLQLLRMFLITNSREVLTWSKIQSSEAEDFWSMVREFSRMKQMCMKMMRKKFKGSTNEWMCVRMNENVL